MPYQSILTIALVASLSIVSVTTPSMLLAQDVNALTPKQQERLGVLLERAKKSYDKGQFNLSIEALEEAYALLPNAGIQRRLADLYESLGQHEKAIASYKLYLKLSPGAPDKGRVESQIANLQAKSSGALSVTSTPAGARIFIKEKQANPLGKTPLELSLKPGKYTVSLEKEGFTSKAQRVEIKRGEKVRVVLALQEEASEPLVGSKTGIYLLGGVGAASAIASLTFFVLARGIDSELDEIDATRGSSPRPSDYDERTDRYNTYQVTSLITGGIAVGALGTAAVLWLMEEDDASSASLEHKPDGLNVFVDPVTREANLQWRLSF